MWVLRFVFVGIWELRVGLEQVLGTRVLGFDFSFGSSVIPEDRLL